ncbi:meiosis specific with OB domains hold'em [Rhynchophorus ferrugineus]|uniref:meiosis specific with OB domains hold'em n=1 Tax=Rhynchophorus ferrugineus TaxID=354439 RepID=UPI003FCE43B4
MAGVNTCSTFCSGQKRVMDNNVTLQRVNLRNLDPNLNNVMIVAIIIAKQRPRVVETQENQRSVYRAVWNFTIRDSPQHYINATYWGNVDQILDISNKYDTGDVVEVLNPLILVRKVEDRSEQYHPMVTSPYKLSLNERSGLVGHPDKAPYTRLLNYPTKPTTTFIPFQNIHTNGSNINSGDILGALRGLGQIRMINSRFDANQMMKSEKIQLREIELFDHTSPSLKVTLWDPDLIKRSNNWRPRTTLLFLTDVRIEWSVFVQAFVAKTTGRTVVTENPITSEAETLFRYAQTAPIEMFDIVAQVVASIPNNDLNDDVVTVRHLQARINDLLQSKTNGNKSFTVTMMAFVSHLDLDGLSQTLLKKCAHCKTVMEGNHCTNLACQGKDWRPPEITFDIQVMLSDHTGTLRNCRLSGGNAEDVLGCSAQEFAVTSDDDKCNLKWRYLLERCKVRLAIIFMVGSRPILSVLQMHRVSGEEVAKRLPMC